MLATKRGRLRALAVTAVLAAVAFTTGYGAVEPAAPAVAAIGAPATPDAPLRIDYGSGPDTFGDLYLPAGGTGPYPVVVLIHGGSWAQYRTLAQFAPQATALARQGVAVWNVEYRRVNGAGGWPVTLTDVDDAVTALATVVQQRSGRRLDLRRVHLAGHSAGGHLAAWVAGRHASPDPAARRGIRIRSLTVLAGVLDPVLAVRNGRDGAVRKLLGGGPEEVPERYQEASPIAHLPRGIHVSALHGEADRVVDPEQSRRYVAAARAAGNTTDLQLLPGVGHAEFTTPTSSAWASAFKVVLDNVERLR
ncbi:alpha/beta hydrolase family protein [Nocardia blacklockiae]|uniref:alpha/beta hydrolase family protein n=1 Tax=Nocardia blacklockiae TaxID=480036 RepID=UPI002B4AFC45|nr:alpha/beta fold hydrolase [Nocardia blacklockiae]